MPSRSPVLADEDVHDLAVAAFAPAGEKWGLEVELLVGGREDPLARPSPGDLPTRTPLPAGSAVTVEPGGQVEISTAPWPDVDGALDALHDDERALTELLEAAGLRVLPAALDTYRPPRRILDLPRYRAMEAFFDAGGPDGRRMMCNTASTQVNLGHLASAPAERWQLLHRLAPVLVAVFANSPGRDAHGTSWASLRQRVWTRIDPGRTRPALLHPDPVESWRRYLLAADVMMIGSGPESVAVPPGLSFGTWMREGHPAGWPDVDDLRQHATTLFPPVRPRGWLEMRVLDALPRPVREIAVLVVAAAVTAPAADVLAERLPDTSAWWLDAARHGLDHPGLAHAATVLFDAIEPVLPAVTARPERVDGLLRYRASHVGHRLPPWALPVPPADRDETGVHLDAHAAAVPHRVAHG